MTLVAVDIGNTRIKWARVDGVRPAKTQAAVHSNWSEATYRRRLISPDVSGLIVASVAGAATDRKLARAARQKRVPILFVTVPRRAGGITVGYRDPWRLGVDRFAAMIGAHDLFKGVPLLVVGVGTALTLDLLGARGRHIGGAIIPSPQLMISTLLNKTSGIQRRAQGGHSGARVLFGRSTRDAIGQGAVYAAAALIDRAVDDGALLVKTPPLVVMTGGGSPAVRPKVHSHCVGVADLTLRGLAVLAAGNT